jgi:hypothetical protein
LAFEDLKEKITNQAKNTWDSIQDSSVYINLRDRFENLSPVMQKVVLGAAATTLSLVILSFPYGSLISSDEFKTQFEDTRKLTQDLLKAARESSNIPQVTPPPPVETLQAAVQAQLQRANLLPEQIAAINPVQASSDLIPKQLISYGLEVSLAKLNLTQITELGYQLSIQGDSRGMTVKLTDMEVRPNVEDPRYMDVVYKLIGIKVPEFSPIFTQEKPTKKGVRPRGSRNKPSNPEPSNPEPTDGAGE